WRKIGHWRLRFSRIASMSTGEVRSYNARRARSTTPWTDQSCYNPRDKREDITMAIHRFDPTIYYTAMGTYPAVVHVSDGDTVQTTTVDARGQDAHNRKVAEPGNPQTGPF